MTIGQRPKPIWYRASQTRGTMAPFDPVSAAIGGALIGLAATLLMLLTGRIAGIAGILGDLVDLAGGDRVWRLAFVAGLIAAPLAMAAAGTPCAPRRCRAGSYVVIAGLLSDSARGSAMAAPRVTASAASRGCRRARSRRPRRSWRSRCSSSRSHATRCEVSHADPLRAALRIHLRAGLVISGMTDTALCSASSTCSPFRRAAGTRPSPS